MKNKSEITARVKHFLETIKELRDNDNRLLANIWWADFTKLYGDQITSVADDYGRLSGVQLFLKALAGGELTNHKTIVRVRAKIQEEHKELRGEKYKERKDYQDQWADEFKKNKIGKDPLGNNKKSQTSLFKEERKYYHDNK